MDGNALFHLLTVTGLAVIAGVVGFVIGGKIAMKTTRRRK